MGQSRISARHANVDELAAELELNEDAYRRALEIAHLIPDKSDWRRYIDRFLMAVGVLLITAGITAFFAWNWADLGHFYKFALIQGGIVVTVLLAWRLKIDTLGASASLLAGAILVGVLLAVYGQVYQTGADPYGLFLSWALLILPWAIIGRQSGLWFLFVVLLNLAVIMYWTQVLFPPEGWWSLGQILGPLVWLWTTVTDSRLASVLFLLNGTALLAWEYFASRGIEWLQSRWAPRLIVLIALNTVILPTVIIIFGEGLGVRLHLKVLSPALMAIAFAACIYYYQYRKHDLYILTCTLMGAILVIMSFTVRHILTGFFSSLILAIFLMIQVSAAAYWLRHVSQRWESES
jgi:uncharacterized membrane protein